MTSKLRCILYPVESCGIKIGGSCGFVRATNVNLSCSTKCIASSLFFKEKIKIYNGCHLVM